MFKVIILRRDGTSDVERSPVKHLIVRGPVLTLYLGEHGKDRLTEHWPLDVIDHVQCYELDNTHGG